LNVWLENDKVVIEPYRLVPSSQAYFWSNKNQEAMLDAKEDVIAGHVRDQLCIVSKFRGNVCGRCHHEISPAGWCP